MTLKDTTTIRVSDNLCLIGPYYNGPLNAYLDLQGGSNAILYSWVNIRFDIQTITIQYSSVTLANRLFSVADSMMEHMLRYACFWLKSHGYDPRQFKYAIPRRAPKLLSTKRLKAGIYD